MSDQSVTVIIPTHNSAPHLAEAVESVLKQTHRDFEIIVVDDGSTDDTRDVLEPYRDRISYIHQENQGSYKARNTGILKSKNPYIAFLDADDLWFPDKLEVLVGYLESHPDIGLVFSDATLFNGSGALEGTFWKKRGCYEEMMKESGRVGNGFALLMEKNFILPSAALVRRECFEKAGLFDEQFRNVGDKDMWLRISLQYPLARVPFPLIRRRIHPYDQRQVESIQKSIVAVVHKMERLFPDRILASGVDTRRILGPLYYSLGRIYWDQTKLSDARGAFRTSLRNRFSIRALLFWMGTFAGTRGLGILRRIKGRRAGVSKANPSAGAGEHV
jgi:glycosyltransferase involved in cell wall biosynthesis